MSAYVDTQAIAAATYTTSGNSGPLPNLSANDVNSRAVLLVNVPNNPTGTTPTLTVTLEVSPDGGTTWFPVAAATSGSLNAISKTRVVVPDLIEPTFRVVWTLTGTTPSFSGVQIWVVFQ